ncbi:hypothetical protein IFM89_027062 [Coptis chinensis]|uniref:Uncharacterized protein n=1 Tax=Coptis chinensis TaxID=261450 RepID=A0A835LVK8_9MAGN|nr:hypothetical protein IFM89_027062 [Coptis chinensis]
MGSRIQDKTIAFIGDSLGRPHFQSLIVRMVMVTGGEEIPDVHNIKSNYGMASLKLVVLFVFVLMVGLIGSRAARRTFFITGHHCNSGKLASNRWMMYVDGRPNTDKKMGLTAKSNESADLNFSRYDDTFFEAAGMCLIDNNFLFHVKLGNLGLALISLLGDLTPPLSMQGCCRVTHEMLNRTDPVSIHYLLHCDLVATGESSFNRSAGNPLFQSIQVVQG